MSFYVTLPSDASINVYPDNRQSNFTVLLKEPIKFNGDYEVGLAEINYFNLLKTHIGEISVVKKTCVRFDPGRMRTRIF